MNMFGNGDALYDNVTVRYFRIFPFHTFIVGTQILGTQFFLPLCS